MIASSIFLAGLCILLKSNLSNETVAPVLVFFACLIVKVYFNWHILNNYSTYIMRLLNTPEKTFIEVELKSMINKK